MRGNILKILYALYTIRIGCKIHVFKLPFTLAKHVTKNTCYRTCLGQQISVHCVRDCQKQVLKHFIMQMFYQCTDSNIKSKGNL